MTITNFSAWHERVYRAFANLTGENVFDVIDYDDLREYYDNEDSPEVTARLIAERD